MSRGNHNYSEKGKNDYSTTAANKADVGHTLQQRLLLFFVLKI